MRKRDHAIGRMVVLESHFQRVLVRHRAAGRQETMFQLRAGFASSIHQQFRQITTVSVLLQVALHDRITNRCVDSSFNDQRMAMAVTMHANAGDHVQLNAAIGDFDVTAVADTTTKIGKESAATAVLAELVQ